MDMGIIGGSMARPEANEDISPAAVREKNISNMPTELQKGYERLVTAGMKIMFDKKSNKLLLQQLQRDVPMAQRLGEGTAALVLILWDKSNQTMPPQLIIPVGTELLVQAADFAKQSGLATITNKDIGDGVQAFLDIIFKKFNIDPQKLQQMMGDFDRTKIEQFAAQRQPQGV